MTKNTKLLGYKITNIQREKKYGIAADSLKMLKAKAALKFDVKNPCIYLAKDGTEVQDEEYFSTIEPQTLFIVAAELENIESDFQIMYGTIRKKLNVIQTGVIITQFFKEHKDTIKNYVSGYVPTTETEKLMLKSCRDEHADWFKGFPQNLNTKEKVMCRRAQDRIRGYFYKLKDEVTTSILYKTNANARRLIEEALVVIRSLLSSVDYFSTYFDRNCKRKHSSVATVIIDELDGKTPRKKIKIDQSTMFKDFDLNSKFCISLCNERGDFICQGLWNEENCKYCEHKINPYASRENAILFQIWNLDHQIEISRSIMPSFLQHIEDIVKKRGRCLVHNKIGKHVSVLKYFIEIFTMDNLKLVHIVCHEKGSHKLESNGGILCENCDEYKFICSLIKSE